MFAFGRFTIGDRAAAKWLPAHAVKAHALRWLSGGHSLYYWHVSSEMFVYVATISLNILPIYVVLKDEGMKVACWVSLQFRVSKHDTASSIVYS